MFISKVKHFIIKITQKIRTILRNILNCLFPCKRPVIRLDPKLIKKYKNKLVKPPVYKPMTIKKHNHEDHDQIEQSYHIDICKFKEQILPEEYPKTKVWGYGGYIKNSRNGRKIYYKGSPGATIEAKQGVPVKVKWVNRLCTKHPFAVDPTVHWANPNNMPMEPRKPWPKFPPGFREAQWPVPVVTHLHGGEVQSDSDGHPEAWYTRNGLYGPAYQSSVDTYPNQQEATTLWYHDHALGITRLNVYAGLAGFYLLREGHRECELRNLVLPKDEYEFPLVIQDRMFLTNGSLYYSEQGINPEIHPYWVPEFFGDTIMVNGKVWPKLDVERRQYRFRVLNGSNARFYNLKLSNGMKFIQIGSDGGYLAKPVTLTSLLLAPAERADILIDFSEIAPGASIIMQNDAKAPYPDGDSPDPDTVGQIMQFFVPLLTSVPVKPPQLPDCINCIPLLKPERSRTLTLNEVAGPNGPIEVLLNGVPWSAEITEHPLVGTTEMWEIVNLTMDTHPIHLHLIQFQILNRQEMDVEGYQKLWEDINGAPPFEKPPKSVPVTKFLSNPPMEPDENERGWKDTVRMNPGQVTRILVRFAPQRVPATCVKPGENLFPFDPSTGPGYVWHCHILDHDDNEMMRPYKVDCRRTIKDDRDK